jgi:sec-independent protein translocase protein TatB
MLSIPHMLVVFVIVLVVFGPQKLPELARSLGKLMAEFRKASSDFRGAFEEEMKDLERQAREVERKKAADVAAKAANDAPVQDATLATPPGTETPAIEADVVSSSTADESADVRGSATADAFGEPIDARVGARVTEGSADLVVTPVAESVPRSSATVQETPETDPNEVSSEAAPKNVNGTGSEAVKSSTASSVRVDVPHDQQPA